MEEEILQLKAELEKQRNRCARLEDELDDLSIDNDRLRKLLAAGGGSHSSGFTSKNVTSHSNNSGGGLLPDPSEGQSNSTDTNIDWRELLIDGNSTYADTVQTKFENACGGMNAICVAFCAIPGIGILPDTVHTYDAIVCGGVDKILRIYGSGPSQGGHCAENLGFEDEFKSVSKPILLRSYLLSAPILSIDTYGSYVACSLMDGSHAVINISGSSEVSDVTLFKDHTKYVVMVKWSPDGIYLATISHDKTINLYKKSLTSDGIISFIKVHTARFIVTPECAVFAKNSKKNTEISTKVENLEEKINNDLVRKIVVDEVEKEVEDGCDWELIIGLRDTPHLTYLHCETYEQRFVTLNESAWDMHCSFTPLHLAVSPNKKYLLIATDKNFHFIVKIGKSQRLRFLAGGHSSGDFGKPRVSWDNTGKYVYCNNEEGTSISIYSVCTERSVRSLSVHTGSVRDVICHPTKPIMASASYDKSVILFSIKSVNE